MSRVGRGVASCASSRCSCARTHAARAAEAAAKHHPPHSRAESAKAQPHHQLAAIATAAALQPKEHARERRRARATHLVGVPLLNALHLASLLNLLFCDMCRGGTAHVSARAHKRRACERASTRSALRSLRVATDATAPPAWGPPPCTRSACACGVVVHKEGGKGESAHGAQQRRRAAASGGGEAAQRGGQQSQPAPPRPLAFIAPLASRHSSGSVAVFAASHSRWARRGDLRARTRRKARDALLQPRQARGSLQKPRMLSQSTTTTDAHVGRPRGANARTAARSNEGLLPPAP